MINCSKMHEELKRSESIRLYEANVSFPFWGNYFVFHLILILKTLIYTKKNNEKNGINVSKRHEMLKMSEILRTVEG